MTEIRFWVYEAPKIVIDDWSHDRKIRRSEGVVIYCNLERVELRGKVANAVTNLRRLGIRRWQFTGGCNEHKLFKKLDGLDEHGIKKFFKQHPKTGNNFYGSIRNGILQYLKNQGVNGICCNLDGQYSVENLGGAKP